MNQIKRMPGGMKFLVDLRAEILQASTPYEALIRMSECMPQELRAKPTAELKAMEADLRRMLLSWYAAGSHKSLYLIFLCHVDLPRYLHPP